MHPCSPYPSRLMAMATARLCTPSLTLLSSDSMMPLSLHPVSVLMTWMTISRYNINFAECKQMLISTHSRILICAAGCWGCGHKSYEQSQAQSHGEEASDAKKDTLARQACLCSRHCAGNVSAHHVFSCHTMSHDSRPLQFLALVLRLSAYWLGWSPTTFYRIYTAEAFILFTLRWALYRIKKWHYYLFDFCYVANVLLLLHIWVFPHSAFLHKVSQQTSTSTNSMHCSYAKHSSCCQMWYVCLSVCRSVSLPANLTVCLSVHGMHVPLSPHAVPALLQHIYSCACTFFHMTRAVCLCR